MATGDPIPRRALLAGGLGLAAARPAAAAGLRLRAAAARAGVLYGAAIEPQTVDADPAFADLVRAQCAVLTPENAMKWTTVQLRPRQYDFTAADRVVQIARAQDAAVHGHCLIWHEAMPDWLRTALAAGDPRSARALLVDHIRTVAGRYAGAVGSWDVVNEPVERNDRRPDGLRASPWLDAIGPDYLALAFHTARAAAPRATLALADYGLEYDDEPWMVEKRATLLQRMAALKAAGAPVDALSIQGHLDGARAPAFGAGLQRFLREVAGLGLEVFVTELDVDDQKMQGPIAQRDRRSAMIYQSFVSAVLAQPATTRVVTWGLSDRHTSKSRFFPRVDGQPVRPLPFDRDLAPKPSAYALAAAFGRRSV